MTDESKLNKLQAGLNIRKKKYFRLRVLGSTMRGRRHKKKGKKKTSRAGKPNTWIPLSRQADRVPPILFVGWDRRDSPKNLRACMYARPEKYPPRFRVSLRVLGVIS